VEAGALQRPVQGLDPEGARSRARPREILLGRVEYTATVDLASWLSRRHFMNCPGWDVNGLRPNGRVRPDRVGQKPDIAGLAAYALLGGSGGIAGTAAPPGQGPQ